MEACSQVWGMPLPKAYGCARADSSEKNDATHGEVRGRWHIECDDEYPQRRDFDSVIGHYG